MTDHKSHWLPVDDPKNSLVDGAPANHIQEVWQCLDWTSWRIDGYTISEQYFHVGYLPDSEPGQDGRESRIRCRWILGMTYRRRTVCSVTIGFRDRRLWWIVRTKLKGKSE